MEAVPFIQNVYDFRRHNHTINRNLRNCTHGALYEDTFTLYINNFTSDKNGYYWCQIFVNGSSLEPSQHYTWFYADDSSSCTQQFYFCEADEAQCANMTYSMPLFPPVMISDPVIIPTSTSSSVTITANMTSTISLTTLASVTNTEPVPFYAGGILSVLVLFVGALAVLMLIFYVHKNKKREEPKIQ